MLYDTNGIPGERPGLKGFQGLVFNEWPESGTRYTERRGAVGGASGMMTGAFSHLYVHTDGHTYLQGGTVTGGSGAHTESDIKVIDSGTGPTKAAGTHMYVNASGAGVAPDGVLIPGFNLSSASIGYASSVPPNTLPTASVSTGKNCYVDLGVFTDTSFLPSGSGNIQISFCPGAYSVDRV